jgi:hypothetical protein
MGAGSLGASLTRGVKVSICSQGRLHNVQTSLGIFSPPCASFSLADSHSALHILLVLVHVSCQPESCDPRSNNCPERAAPRTLSDRGLSGGTVIAGWISSLSCAGLQDWICHMGSIVQQHSPNEVPEASHYHISQHLLESY